jgi:mannose-1-phosphate guanylyltransferase/mannose-6-phosphate isomerase
MAPSDHVMARADAFADAIARAAPMARDHLVLFGVIPTAPETGYGYIEIGETLDGPLTRVSRFVEKPSLEVARTYLEGGRHLWNAGIFLFSPRVLIGEMERLAPEVAAATREALARGQRQDGAIDLDAEAFAACPSISVDYAVMERTDKAVVIPMDAGWSDIGSWSALWAQGPHDENGNLIHGEAALIDCQDCLVWSEGKTIGAVGLSDVVIVQTGEAVVVLPKSRAQDVKRLVELLTARGAR